jgi:hypothetical protein
VKGVGGKVEGSKEKFPPSHGSNGDFSVFREREEVKCCYIGKERNAPNGSQPQLTFSLFL